MFVSATKHALALCYLSDSTSCFVEDKKATREK